MSTLATPRVLALATGVTFNEVEMTVSLADGRSISAPLEWFPRLLNASPSQRSEWRLIGNGIGISWEEIDEDLSIAGLLGG